MVATQTCVVQRTRKNDEEAVKPEEAAAEGPSNEELKREVEGILDSAGAEFSMKDLLAKLRKSLIMLPACPPSSMPDRIPFSTLSCVV